MGQGWESDACKLPWGVERICNYSLLRSLGEGRFIGRLSFPPVILSFSGVFFTTHTKHLTSGHQIAGGGGGEMDCPHQAILCGTSWVPKT